MSFLSKAMSVQDEAAIDRPLRSALGRIFAKEDDRQERKVEVADCRRSLMEAISDFLIGNRLAISVQNLIAAHGAFSGLNPSLQLRINSRVEAGEPIDQQWLDDVSGVADEQQDVAVVEKLVAELESSLGDFTKSTREAHKQTQKYSDSLEQHIDDLEQGRDTGAMIVDMIGLTRGMLERSRKAEAELRERDNEAKSLRRNLETARRDAEIDHLTGLPNRRAFGTLFERHFDEARSACEPLVVAFCDIDHFKRVNDTHGHEAGDRVIKAIADLLATISDKNCNVARHGGEEFVMLFRGISLAEAEARLNNAREQMANRRFRNRATDEPFGQITFSGGLADVSKHPDPSAALAAADAALYRAKAGGRNQVIVAD